MYFSVHLEPTEATQEGGKQPGAIFFSLCFFHSPGLPPAVLALNFYREKGTVHPFRRQRATSKFGTHESFLAYPKLSQFLKNYQDSL